MQLCSGVVCTVVHALISSDGAANARARGYRGEKVRVRRRVSTQGICRVGGNPGDWVRVRVRVRVRV